jgi:hypothetical protein
MSDNFHFDISAGGDLVDAMTIAFRQQSKGAVGYVVTAEKGMVFFWSDYEKVPGYQPLPFPFKAADAADFAGKWLKHTASYGSEPDHDGDNSPGWRVYNEAWTHVNGWHSAFCAVRPVWMMNGK